MQFRFFFVIGALLMLVNSSPVKAMENNDTVCKIVSLIDDTIFVSVEIPVKDSVVAGETKENKKKKTVAAIFAFPFPFGFMGAHRVMLGTAPWVPVVYAATFGGCFGILPLIDFFVITLSKDISEYENNPHIFMWVK